VSKSFWGFADYFKPEFFPKAYGGLVCTHYNVELDSQKSFFFGKGDGMLAKQFARSPSMIFQVYHVTAIGYVAA